ncbi:MAG: hypothetical protein BroJett011_45920 [Chloroflexota bacterium]|nr:MAG: hypothetical protein BroJett011_45920 [Chloroflexota bacterium]
MMFKLFRNVKGRLGRLAIRVKANKPLRNVYFVTEETDWVIRREGEYIIQQARQSFPNIACILTTEYTGLEQQLIHFGSLWTFIGGGYQVHKTNRVVVTIFHGDKFGTDPNLRQGIITFCQHLKKIDTVVTASSIMHQRLLTWGVPADKIKVIPLGADLSIFRLPSPEQHHTQRQRLGIPEKSICIGSFQKDGNGWAEGLEPKLIKGPDIFVETVRKLADRYPIFVLLTGPARGYMKRNLEEAGIPYRHEYVQHPNQLASYYHCLDLYLITSREEGGPKALLECMATGVPLVSTHVGMAPDIIVNDVNGFLVDVENINALVTSAVELIENSTLREAFIKAALQTVRAYHTPELAKRYCEQVYRPLLS